ncbi:chromosome partition protein Smc-like [Mytilus edulis]|uniref:chromosome partition protein Smc-like n=1 Tax=Mytilus edulis TaxID=6550 RepID=UPI0039EF8462
MAKKLPPTAIIEVFPNPDTETMKKINHRPKEQDILTKHWGLVKQSVVLNHIVDPLIENHVISVDQWMDLKNRRMTEPERMEELLYIILKSKQDSVFIFLKALRKRGYKHVADELDGKISVQAPPTTYVGIADKRGTITRFKQVPVVKDDIVDSYNNPSLTSSASSDARNDDSVKQTDLEKMKDEIKGELRQLRANLETERKEDRQEMKDLKRQHTDLRTNFEKIQAERTELKRKINELSNNVDQLKTNLASKEKEYADIKRKNNFLLEELSKKSDAISKAVQEKEKEKTDIEKKLETKNVEYKELQVILNTLKEDHEERLARLKSINKEKIRLEQHAKTSEKQKKDLEMQIKALDDQIARCKIDHDKEISLLQQDLDNQTDVIFSLEKDKAKLENKLIEIEENNEDLRDRNVVLQEKLQSSEEENAIMRARLQAFDMKKYAVPPYNAVVRGKNYRSSTQRSSWSLFEKK